MTMAAKGHFNTSVRRYVKQNQYQHNPFTLLVLAGLPNTPKGNMLKAMYNDVHSPIKVSNYKINTKVLYFSN